MIINVNGESIEVAEQASLIELIKQLKLEGKRYAIEVNEDIIARSEHASYRLNSGDSVEVVVAIGGG